MVTAQFSERVKSLRKQLKPYFKPTGGLKEDAPPEARKLFDEYKKRVTEEAWLD
jgi:hypothetical protein